MGGKGSEARSSQARFDTSVAVPCYVPLPLAQGEKLFCDIPPSSSSYFAPSIYLWQKNLNTQPMSLRSFPLCASRSRPKRQPDQCSFLKLLRRGQQRTVSQALLKQM